MVRAAYEYEPGQRVVEGALPHRHGVVIERPAGQPVTAEVWVRWDDNVQPVVPHNLQREEG